MMNYADLKREIRFDDIEYDPWGTALCWQFAAAEILHFERAGEPDHWEYRPGAGQSEAGADDWRVGLMRDVAASELIKFGNLLCRLVRRAENANKSY